MCSDYNMEEELKWGKSGARKTHEKTTAPVREQGRVQTDRMVRYVEGRKET